MYALNLRIPIKQDTADAAEASIEASTVTLSEQKGFRSFVLLRPTLPEQPYIAVSLWDSRYDFDAWKTTDDFKRLFMGSAIGSHDDLRPVLEAFEVALAIPAPESTLREAEVSAYI